MDKAVHLIGLVAVVLTIALPYLNLKFRWEHVVGAWGLLWLTIGSGLGLFWAPPEMMMGDVGRILYVHVPAAWIAMIVFTISLVCAVGFLFTGKYGWDWAVEAATEVGVMQNALLLVLGAIFGKPTWNTYWTWDPRLTASLVMLLTFVGVLLLRTAIADPGRKATYSSVATIIAYMNIPITYMSVRWWASMHQMQSTPNTIDGDMKFILYMCTWAFLSISIWFIVRRWRIAKATAMAEAPEPLDLAQGKEATQ